MSPTAPLAQDLLSFLEEIGCTAAQAVDVSELFFGQRPDLQTVGQRLRRLRERRARNVELAAGKPALRAEALQTFGSVCQYCNKRGRGGGPDGWPWELDRIKPGKLGGEYVAENVTLACRRCNVRKGAIWPFGNPQSLEAARSKPQAA